MIINGVDLAGLAHEAGSVEYPAAKQGRTVHIDADFLAYQVSYEKPEDPKDFGDMKHNATVAVEHIKKLAGATKVHLHLTPGTSDKGDRYNIALLKEYQGNRVDKPKPRYLHIMRQYLADEFPATMHQRCEADDGMSSSQYAALSAGDTQLSIIASKDKDLSMVPGLAVDWDTGRITEEPGFGSIWLDETKSAKKLVGRGYKFFWAQMLMGDSADNISGLPLLAPSIRIQTRDLPKDILAIVERMETSVDGLLPIKLQAKLDTLAPSKIGPAKTFQLLEGITSNKDAFLFVKDAYKALDGSFKNWRTGEPISWQQAFISEAQLLWMRRDKHNADCVKQFIKEIQ